MAPAFLLDLAPEILVHIFLKLHFTEIFACAQACSSLSEVIAGSSEINYRIQLQIAGLQDNPSCNLPSEARLQLLTEREKLWNSFKWKTQAVFPVPHNTSGIYELSPSTYFMGIADDEDPSATKGIQSARLSTVAVEDEATASISWKDFVFGIKIIELGIAIEEHDLLACLFSTPNKDDPTAYDVAVGLVRYSTAEWHDAAKEMFLPICTVAEDDGTPQFVIEICGENLAIDVCWRGGDSTTFRDLLYVYDWKTGRNKSPEGCIIFNPGAVFLQEDILIQLNTVRKSLDIIYIPPSSALDENSEPSKVRTVRQLLLPQSEFSSFLTSFTSRSTPNPTAASAFPEYTPSGRPFANDPAEAIMLFTMDFFLYDFEKIRSFVMFTHRKALLALVPWERVPVDFEDPGTFDDLAWEKWGPSITRWFGEDEINRPSVTSVSGQRYAALKTTMEEPSKDYPNGRRINTLQMLNFNPCAVNMARHGRLDPSVDVVVVGGGEEEEEGVELAENVCDGAEVFHSKYIVGRLPYVRVGDVEWNYTGVMLNEERLMGMRIKRGTRFMESLTIMHFG